MDKKREGDEDDAPAIDPNDGGSMRGEKMVCAPSRTSHRTTNITRYVTQVRAMKRRKRDLDEAVPQTSRRIDRRARDPHRGRPQRFIHHGSRSVGQRRNPRLPGGAGAVWEENVVQYGTRKSLRKDPVEWHNGFWLPTFEPMRDAKPTKAHDAWRSWPN